MDSLGHTRSAHRQNYLLQTPDVFVRAVLPGMHKATAVVHISPAGGAAFTQYTAEMDAGGTLPPAVHQRFVYVLEGAIGVEGRRMGRGDFAYLPSGHDAGLKAESVSRLAVIEKPYETLTDQTTPEVLIGQESAAPVTHLMDDPWLEGSCARA
jgi:(S)-ureidoglycine aminohydrolase